MTVPSPDALRDLKVEMPASSELKTQTDPIPAVAKITAFALNIMNSPVRVFTPVRLPRARRECLFH
jgi:hypothetical protein